jgi:hypothetical protein
VKRILAILFLSLAVWFVVSLSISVGKAKERLRWYDNQVYWFTKYSEHLHQLADQRKIGQLTNDIIFFDARFQSNNVDGKVLQEIMYQILNLGSNTDKNAQVAK